MAPRTTLKDGFTLAKGINMLPLETERNHLFQAHQHLGSYSRRIHRQVAMIRRLRRSRIGDQDALALQRLFHAPKRTVSAHRHLIVESLLRRMPR